MTAPHVEILTEDGQAKAILTGNWNRPPQRLPSLRDREVVINYAHGWQGGNLDFLSHSAFLEVERLQILAPSLTDLRGIYHLVGLKKLTTEDASRELLDIDHFPELEELNLVGWSLARLGKVLESSRIKKFAVSGYPGRDLEPFKTMLGLISLTLQNTRIESLAGSKALVNLLKLGVLRAPKLRSLEGLEGAKLANLWIERARGLTSLKGIHGAPNLRVLVLNDCNSVASLLPLQSLDNLVAVHLGWETDVKDGNLAVLKSLPRLKHASFIDRRHYSDMNADLPKMQKLPL